MKVARLHAAGDVRLHDEPEPVPGAGEELVRVTAVGLCGSDRHWFLDGAIGDSVLRQPLALGHEAAGVIESGPRAGLRVALDPAIPCGRCDLCTSDLEHLCRIGRFAGHSPTDGALRTHMAWPAALLEPLPDSIDDVEAALLEPLGIALHAVALGKVRPGMPVGVFGCGPIGLLLIQVLCAAGASDVFVTDPLPHRLAAATALGARALSPDRLRDVPELAVTFDAAGEDGSVEDAIATARPAGRVVLVGIPASDRTSFSASVARRKGLTILIARRMRARHLREAVALALRGDVKLGGLVSARYPLERASDAFRDLAEQRGLKVIVQPSA